MKVRILTFSVLFLAMFSLPGLFAMQDGEGSQSVKHSSIASIEEKTAVCQEKLLSLEDITELLRSKKIEYAKKIVLPKRYTGKNKGTLIRIIYTSALIRTCVFMIILYVIWEPLGSLINAKTVCSPIESKDFSQSMLPIANQTLQNLTLAGGETIALCRCKMSGNGFISNLYDNMAYAITLGLAFGIVGVFTGIAYEICSLSPTPSERLEDVIGLDPQTAERIERYVDMFKNPKKYKQFGAVIPRGLLLVGPAGTGKSLIAKAITGTMGENFYDAPATSFKSEKGVSHAFKSARKTRPSVIFIDEIDAIGAIDKDRLCSGAADMQSVKVLNQLLLELGSAENDQILVVAATNYPHVLNPALVRSGRFDEVIEIPKPNFLARVKLLIHYIFKNRVIDVDSITPEFILALTRRTENFTASDFEAIVNHAALIACRKNCKKINTDHIYEGCGVIESNKRALSKKCF